ncbi:hypothetical protein TcG_09152, partial [Trypanosoma cruzi]
ANEENQQHCNPLQLTLHRRQFRFRHCRFRCENLGKIKKGGGSVVAAGSRDKQHGRQSETTRPRGATQPREYANARQPTHRAPPESGTVRVKGSRPRSERRQEDRE